MHRPPTRDPPGVDDAGRVACVCPWLAAPSAGRVHTLVHTHAGSRLAAQCPCTEKPRYSGVFLRVSEGTRTPDRLDHNQELYQLSYAHHASREPVYPSHARLSIGSTGVTL